MGHSGAPFFIPYFQSIVTESKPQSIFRPIYRIEKKRNMKFLTLKQIKAQCRIEEDFTMEDTKLTLYGDSAEQVIFNICQRPYEDFIETYGAIPQDVVHAALMLVTASYEHNAAVSMQNLSIVPYGFDMLIKPYMRLTSATDGDVQIVTLGSDVKIAFTADLPDGLLLKDVNFTLKVINMSEKEVAIDVLKDDCIMTDDGASYVVMVDSETLGIGTLMLRLTVYIPDTDYQSGTRKEVIKINPHIRITG